jgi:hypothetical protein
VVCAALWPCVSGVVANILAAPCGRYSQLHTCSAVHHAMVCALPSSCVALHAALLMHVLLNISWHACTAHVQPQLSCILDTLPRKLSCLCASPCMCCHISAYCSFSVWIVHGGRHAGSTQWCCDAVVWIRYAKLPPLCVCTSCPACCCCLAIVLACWHPLVDAGGMKQGSCYVRARCGGFQAQL